MKKITNFNLAAAVLTKAEMCKSIAVAFVIILSVVFNGYGQTTVYLYPQNAENQNSDSSQAKANADLTAYYPDGNTTYCGFVSSGVSYGFEIDNTPAGYCARWWKDGSSYIGEDCDAWGFDPKWDYTFYGNATFQADMYPTPSTYHHTHKWYIYITGSTSMSVWASNITQTSAKLNWNPKDGAYNYSVRYKKTSQSTWTTVNDINNTYYNISSGLSCETNYEWQVKVNCVECVNGSTTEANSNWFSSATFTTDCCPVTTPSNPTNNSSPPYCNSVTITRSGSPPSGVTWYWQNTSCGTSTSYGSGSTFSATSSGTYYIRARSSCGEWSSGCGSTTVTVNHAPGSASVSGPSSPCVGDNEEYTASASDAEPNSWVWTLPPGWSGNSSTNSINVIVGSNSGSVTATPNNDCGSGTTGSKSVNPESAPVNPGTITGEEYPCEGSTETYCVTDDPNVDTYHWSKPSDWTGSSSSNCITFTVGSSAGYIEVEPENGCGFGNSSNLQVNPTEIPFQPDEITGEINPCDGSPNEVYSVIDDPNVTTYNWTLPSGWTGTSSTNSISVTVGNSGGTIVITPYNGNCAGPSRSLAVAPIDVPVQPEPITGDITPCIGSNQTYSVTDDTEVSSYSWTLPGDWSGTSTTNSINVTVGSDTANIEVIPTNNCGDGPAQLLSVSPIDIPMAPDTIYGDIIPCVGSTQNYSVANDPNVTIYNWSLPSDWTGTSSTNSISVTIGNISGNIEITPVNDCGNGQPQTLNVNPTVDVPNQPNAIIGDTIPCAGSIIYYSVDSAFDATGYTWNLPGGWSGTSNTHIIVVTVGNSSGVIEVIPSNSCGDGISTTLAVNPVPLPNQPSLINGEISPCMGDTQIYSVQNDTTVTEYAWDIPNNWIGSSDSNSISLIAGSDTGSIEIIPYFNGCAGPSRTLQVVPKDVPSIPDSIVGIVAPCVGSTQIYSITNDPYTTSYLWSLPGDWTGSSTSNSITVTIGNSNGIIEVTPSNICGSGQSEVLQVSPDSLVPQQPSLIVGDTIPCISSTQTYSVTNDPNATSYLWSLPNGWTGTSTTNSITVTVGNNTGNIQVIPSNDCGSGSSSTLSVNMLDDVPEQPSTIVGETDPCIDFTKVYSVVNDPEVTSYTWILPGIDWSGSSATNTLIAIVGSSNGLIEVVPTNVCGDGLSSTLAVIPKDVPSPPDVIYGNINPIQYLIYTYFVTITPGVGYDWNCTGCEILSGDSTNSITAKWIYEGLQTLSVTPFNECGAGTSKMMDIDVITDINEITLSNLIKLYPNPANDKLYIENKGLAIEIEKLTLFNSIGEEIFINKIEKTNTKLFELDFSNYQSGIYFLIIQTNKGLVMKKITIG